MRRIRQKSAAARGVCDLSSRSELAVKLRSPKGMANVKFTGRQSSDSRSRNQAIHRPRYRIVRVLARSPHSKSSPSPMKNRKVAAPTGGEYRLVHGGNNGNAVQVAALFCFLFSRIRAGDWRLLFSMARKRVEQKNTSTNRWWCCARQVSGFPRT